MRKRYKIEILDYMVTSNHIHLLLSSKKDEQISEELRYLHGRIGQWHNLQTLAVKVLPGQTGFIQPEYRMVLTLGVVFFTLI